MNVLRSAGATSVGELAEALKVSESTIRRDLDLLDRNGELVRTYGGAVLRPREAIVDEANNRKVEMCYQEDEDLDLVEKRAIAARAAKFVADDDVVILDIGTTTPWIARELRGRPVTVITSNLAVLDELRDDSTVRLIMIGGVLRRNYRTFVGSLAQSALTQVNADTVFLTCTGVRPSGSVVDDMAVEAPIKQSMIEAADRVVLVATEAKFPGTGALRLCSIANVDVVVTTVGANEQTLNICREAGGQVVFA